MKRYSIAIAYGRKENNKVYFHYHGRTDNLEKAIENYHKSFIRWCQSVQDVNDELHDIANNFHGIKIVDSQTKKVVFEEGHISEELGWKKEYEKVLTKWGGYYTRDYWVKI